MGILEKIAEVEAEIKRTQKNKGKFKKQDKFIYIVVGFRIQQPCRMIMMMILYDTIIRKTLAFC